MNRSFGIIYLLVITILHSHPVVKNLDIERFMGRWYVLALIPNWVEGKGDNSYDDYELNKDGTVDITYYAFQDGKEKNMKQKGFVNKDEPGRWEVQFYDPYIPFFTAPYEVIILDSNYQYMVIGYPNNSFGWVMGRSTKIEDSIYQNILNELESAFGYNKKDFHKVIHDKD